VIRLGDGTDESHRRMQAAIDELWRYAGEMFLADATETELAAAGIVPDMRALQAPWDAAVDAVLAEATLVRPPAGYVQKGGKQGRHTEHLGHLLAEMQFLQRAYPDARW
jgi:ring-1,2-phenylacetyl-CoA epoxidase subunit PaaC